MVRIKSMEIISRNYVRNQVKGCLEAFLKGEQDFKWIIHELASSGIQQNGGMLMGIFHELQGWDERTPRFSAIFKECQQNGWL